MFDAEGSYDGDSCPECKGTNTVTFHYQEGFSELECLDCGFASDLAELNDLARFRGDVLEGKKAQFIPIPIKKIQA